MPSVSLPIIIPDMKPIALSNIRIETPRLVLREFHPSDWRDVSAYSKLRRVVRFLPWGPDSPKQTRDFLRDMARERRRKVRRSFEMAVVLRETGRVIGGCGLRIKNAAQRESDLGYVLHPRYWNLGYTTEAARAMVRFGFKTLKLHRIWSTHDPGNGSSGRVMRKIGMRQEGFLRKDILQKGRWRDSALYAILETDRHSR